MHETESIGKAISYHFAVYPHDPVGVPNIERFHRIHDGARTGR